MTPRPCEALREIQLGNKQIQDFDKPQVFESDLYKQYGVTISHLRQHLRDCKSCIASTPIAQSQLIQYDEVQAEEFKNLLELLDRFVMVRLEYENQIARDRATDLVFGDSEDPPEFDRAEALAEAYRTECFEETEPWIYLWAVQTHVGAGDMALGWLETLTPPSFARVLLFTDRLESGGHPLPSRRFTSTAEGNRRNTRIAA